MPSILAAARCRFRTLFNRANAPSTDPTAPPPPAPRTWTTHEANLALHQCLSSSMPTRPALPNEIILQILEDPSRWIKTYSIHLRASDSYEPLKCVTSYGSTRGSWRVLVTDPISGQQAARLRNVVYSIKSQDQGRSDYHQHHGTYNGSWTWFEAGLTRFEDEGVQGKRLGIQEVLSAGKESERYELQRNRHAGREPEVYRIELERAHELLGQVEDGDRFALWARAMFLGWENCVYDAMIEIYCSDDLTEG